MTGILTESADENGCPMMRKMAVSSNISGLAVRKEMPGVNLMFSEHAANKDTAMMIDGNIRFMFNDDC